MIPIRRCTSARLRRRPRGLLGAIWTVGRVCRIGPLTPLGTVGLVLVLVRPIALIGLAGSVPMIGLLRPVPMIALVGTTVAAAIVVPLVFGTGATPGWLNVGRRNDAGAAQVPTAHADVAPAIVVHRPLAHPCDEEIRCLAVLEDEPGLRPVGTREHDPRAAVVPIRVVVRIIEHHDPEAHAGVVVRAPGRVAHVRVAIVA